MIDLLVIAAMYLGVGVASCLLFCPITYGSEKQPPGVFVLFLWPLIVLASLAYSIKHCAINTYQFFNCDVRRVWKEGMEWCRSCFTE